MNNFNITPHINTGSIDTKTINGYNFRASCNSQNINTQVSEDNYVLLEEFNEYKELNEGFNDISNVENLGFRQIMDLMDYFEINASSLVTNTNYKSDSYLLKDVNKLIYAKETGKTLGEVFVPTFNTNEDAVKNLDAGDVFQLLDSDNISIKLSDGTIKELNISKNTYLDLFPPVQRYTTCQGTGAADCYLVSSLDAVIKTPNGFAQLLSCFEEKDDGSISVSYPNGMYTFNLKQGENVKDFIIPTKVTYHGKEVSNEETDPKDFLLDGAKGMQMLEFLYGYEAINNNENSNQLKNELCKENLDIAKIAELHYNYEKDIKEGVEATILRNDGGSNNELFSMLNGKYFSQNGKKNLLDETFFVSHSIQNTVGIASPTSFFDSATFDNLGLTNSHAYSIRPYGLEDGTVRYKITDPNMTGFSRDLSKEQVQNLFTNIALIEL